jgi:serine/threonine-protein kinase
VPLTKEAFYAQAWSPDGRQLVGHDGGVWHRIWTWQMNADGSPAEPQPRVILDEPDGKRDLRLSPDGKWVAYESNASGRFEIMVASFPTFSERRQISTGGGGAPAWASDGKELFFVRGDGTLMAADIRLGAKIDSGIPHALMKGIAIVPNSGGRPFEITRDGTRVVILERSAQGAAQGPQQVVILNWPAALR